MASVGAEYYGKLLINKVSRSKNLKYSLIIPSATLKNLRLSALAKNLIADNANLNTVQAKCGAEYLQQIDLGYSLDISINLQAKNEEEYNKFVKKYSVEVLWGLISDEKVDVQEIKASKADVIFSVSALQKGGNITKLNAILKDALVVCTPQNIDNCRQKFKEIWNYATSSDGFRASQLNNQYYGTNIPDVLRYHTSSYSSLFFWNWENSYKEMSFAVKHMRNLVYKKIGECYMYKNRGENLEKFFGLKSNELNLVDEQLQKVRLNLNFLENADAECKKQSDIEKCSNIYNQALSNLKPIDLKSLYL